MINFCNKNSINYNYIAKFVLHLIYGFRTIK